MFPLYLASQNHPEHISAMQGTEENNILAGYWFQWPPEVNLATIPIEYNVVCIAFFSKNEQGIPTFKAYSISDEEFKAAVKKLKSQGRIVVISLGGASEQFTLFKEDEEKFKNEIIRVVDTYGFSGVDIDLEGESVTAGQNQIVIPEALRQIKDEFKEKGKEFYITMAPEFHFLRGEDAPYKPYVLGLEGYYDIIFPQYYNQGEDGIWSEELNMFLSQNDNRHKAQFLYTLTHAIVTGTQDYIKIPADKFAIGLPASPESALNGYVENPEDVQWALDRLREEGNAIRGLMTWSINQDAVNGYQFLNWYSPMIFNDKDEI